MQDDELTVIPGPTRTARYSGAAALALIGAALAAFAVVMLLGPSAAVPKIDSAGPLLWLDVRPPVGLVIALERLGALTGALGTAIGLAATRGGFRAVGGSGVSPGQQSAPPGQHSEGWRPAPRLLGLFGAIAVTVFVFLPPAGSTDVLNYASYGRIATLGHSPYLVTPAQLLRSGDPVGLLTPTAWRSVPTIYGPVATAAQWAAAELGGSSMARIVFWIRFSKVLAFLATGAMLLRLAGTDQTGTQQLRRLRVGLLWTANPLMAFWLVGSGHVDAFLALLTAAALLAVRRGGVTGGLLAGVLAGAAIAVKLTFAVVAVGLLWPVRRSAATILAGVSAAAATVGVSYLWPGAASTATMTRRLAAGARFIFYLPHSLSARPALLSALVLAATVVVTVLMMRGLPAENSDTGGVRLMLALAIASLVVLPVQTPWYDALIFVLLALMPASGLDYLLMARCLVLTELVLPGAAPDTGAISMLAAAISHAGLFVLLAVLVVESLRGRWKLAAARPVPALPG